MYTLNFLFYYIIIIILCVFFKVLLLTEILDWTQLFIWMENEYHPFSFSFGYAHRNGPHTWKDLYPESNGSNQSPINIITRYAIVMQPSEPLQWSNYNSGPLSMTITNDGHTGMRTLFIFNEINKST